LHHHGARWVLAVASMPAGMRWRARLPGGGDWSGDYDEEERGGEARGGEAATRRKGTGGVKPQA